MIAASFCNFAVSLPNRINFYSTMKEVLIPVLFLVVFVPGALYSQSVPLKPDACEAVGVAMAFQPHAGKEVVKVIKKPEIEGPDEPTFVRLEGVDLRDGTIEVNVLSRLLDSARPGARGFIGVAFRINEDNSEFECIYLRPTNARADDQLRRNHSIQYFSYPDYKFMRLRKEAPGQYESYADMALNEWIKVKITVAGTEARLFINDREQPSLVVTDLKHGAERSGAIGLFVDNGTEGYFSDVRVSR